MADKVSFPQIPSTVWWGVRALLQRSPSATISERTLGVELQVQEAAARQYIAELKRAGILNDENKATPLAGRWRHDDTYADAVSEILSNAYPEDLIQVAPPELGDRQKVISWFTREGLGVGTAGNKAATYLLIGSATPNESPARGAAASQKNGSREKRPTKQAASTAPVKSQAQKPVEKPARNAQFEPMPLNVNVQIHISAEASSDQIESIFSAMRRYLYDGSN